MQSWIPKRWKRKYVAEPTQTGQTTSYATGDDGNLLHGELRNFTTLKYRNAFGNYLRFTDINGDATTPGTTSYTIDHYTGYGFTLSQATATWATHVANALTHSLSVGGQTLTGFFLPNFKQLEAIRTYDTSFGLAILAETNAQWTSTTQSAVTTEALVLTSSSRWIGAAKSGSNKAIYFRKHYC